MARWVSVEDVRAAYEKKIEQADLAWVDQQIARAERLLGARRPSIQARLDADTLDRQNVVDAVVTAVLRVVRNPEGMGSETEASYLYSLQRDVAGGKLYFTGDDLALIDQRAADDDGTMVLSIPVDIAPYRVPNGRG